MKKMSLMIWVAFSGEVVNVAFKCRLAAFKLLWSLRSMTAVVVSMSSVITAVASAIYNLRLVSGDTSSLNFTVFCPPGPVLFSVILYALFVLCCDYKVAAVPIKQPTERRVEAVN